MVIDRIRKQIGDALNLELRISGSEMVPGGIEIEECTEMIKIFEDAIDLVHISCGTRFVGPYPGGYASVTVYRTCPYS